MAEDNFFAGKMKRLKRFYPGSGKVGYKGETWYPVIRYFEKGKRGIMNLS